MLKSRLNWIAPAALVALLIAAAFGADAIFNHASTEQRTTLSAALGSGEIWQLKDGRAAFYDSSVAATSGEKVYLRTDGQVTVAKTNGIVILDGGRVYWDHSANSATYKPANDRDFYLGTAVGDWASGDTQMLVNLNVQQSNTIDFQREAFDTVFVGTRALGGLDLESRGGAKLFTISATNEAQKIDMLSQFGFARTANAIVELIFNVDSDGAGTVVDVSMGVANATHASDADSIAESLFIHLNANDVNIYAESDDGTNEVAATDTTIDYTEDTPVEVWFDLRDEADIQIYVNGALVLGSSTFRLDNATGPLKLLLHIEKTASTDTYSLGINRFHARLAEQ
jgi:predicted RecA/RadA family phage recombinase